jgi:hypothetical protein
MKGQPSSSRYFFPMFVAAGGFFAIVVYFATVSSKVESPGPKTIESARIESKEPVEPRKEEEKERPRMHPVNLEREKEQPPIEVPKQKEPEPAVQPDKERQEEAPEQRQVELQEEPKKIEEETKPEIKPTVTIVAVLERVEGEVYEVSDARRTLVATGHQIPSGVGLETGSKGSAVVRYPDKTHLAVAAGTSIQEVFDRKGKRLFVAKGQVTAEVTKQPKDQPMIFSTPHGEAKIVGTRLKLVIDTDSTQLDVQEGKVRLTRSKDGKSVDVGSGFTAFLAAGVDLKAKPIPRSREILVWKLKIEPANVALDKLALSKLTSLPDGLALQGGFVEELPKPGVILSFPGHKRDVFTVKAGTAVRFRYFLKKEAPLLFRCFNETRQENFDITLPGVAGRWTPVTLFVKDIASTPGGKKVTCEIGDQYVNFGWRIDRPATPADVLIDQFEVLEIER